MRDCKAFLFPTYYEGFGIPPLEAISAGARQVVVSDTEVMHEIFGASVCYIDPNVYELEIGKTYIDDSLLKRFDWKKSAAKLLKLINTL